MHLIEAITAEAACLIAAMATVRIAVEWRQSCSFAAGLAAGHKTANLGATTSTTEVALHYLTVTAAASYHATFA